MLESYKYLGLDTVVERDHPESGVNLTYISQTSSTGDAGDKYVGLDRFGRVVDQNWYDTATSSSVDEYKYGYNADSDVLYRENVVDAAMSELYGYDGLNQLTSFQRGTLNSTNTAISGTASATQSWGPGRARNFTSVTTNGTTVDNTANQQNEYTAIGSATPTYDANGNLTTDETGQTYVYDAWNQLVTVKNSSSTTIASYTYDGLGRRITETHGSTTTDLYFSAAGQVLEEQVAGTTAAHYVWSPVYVNALVVVDQISGGTTTRLYVMQDANWNVTALVAASSADVVERYVYSPYGVRTVLNASWTSISTSAYGSIYELPRAGRIERCGRNHLPTRSMTPSLGQWLQRDPLGFAAGDLNIGRSCRK